MEHAVVARHQLDITGLSHFEDASFDAIVCYGGPVSYTVDRADDALAELLRVTRPGGPAFLSVMSKVGATRIFLPGVLELSRQDPDFVENVIATGVLPKRFNNGHANNGRAMKVYGWPEFKTLLERHPCELVAASAANDLTASLPEAVRSAFQEPEWQRLLEWELKLRAKPGNLDGGTHILAVLRRL